jgi:NAD(P)-dependent dehydrogenase (short-subunit alcohol dehydrogenase family)
VTGPADHGAIVVTGATGAIGGATATALVRHGQRVVLVARDERRLADARRALVSGPDADRVRTAPCDLARPDSVRAAAAAIRSENPSLAGLVHCAAVFVRARRETPEGFELMFATNHLGPFLLTRELLPALCAGAPSRVIAVSAPSTTPMDFADLQSSREFSPLRAFGATKTANLLFAYELARRSDGTDVTSNAFFPGVVRSKLMREAPAIVRGFAGLAGKGPEPAGTALAWLALDPSLEGVTGTFYKLRKASESGRYSRDPTVQRELWETTETLLSRQPPLSR